MNTISVKNELKDLILSALKKKYTSESCQDNIKTGNHYQSIKLGDSYTQGFRTDRSDLLDSIDFAEKKVLDLGCNLGEMSRGARYRDAYLVDGFEYDTFFIEIGNMVNAYNNMSRVSFYQRDITDSSIYNEDYDIILAFSVYTYIKSVLKNISDICKGVLILETHQLKGNLESEYFANIDPHFKYRKVIAETDWGTNKEKSEKRVVIIFSNDKELIDSCIKKNDHINPST